MSGSLRKDIEEYQQAIDLIRGMSEASNMSFFKNYLRMVCALAQERVAELSRRADIEDIKTEEKP